jgi:penicillin amidase
MWHLCARKIGKNSMRISQRQIPGIIFPSQGKPQHARHPRLKRIVLISASILAVILLLLSALTFWFIQRTLPQTTGTLAVAGLEQPVSVGRDQWGIPHITASTLHDVIFAQGYVTAQDRPFQVELNRRIAQGCLAELFGDDFVSTDAFLRTCRRIKKLSAHVIQPNLL